jgi:hypothetical protein
MTDKLDKILEQLTEQKVLLARIDERQQASTKDMHDLEGEVGVIKNEVNSLKRWKWTTAGGLAVITFGAQYILKHMVK